MMTKRKHSPVLRAGFLAVFFCVLLCAGLALGEPAGGAFPGGSGSWAVDENGILTVSGSVSSLYDPALGGDGSCPWAEQAAAISAIVLADGAEIAPPAEDSGYVSVFAACTSANELTIGSGVNLTDPVFSGMTGLTAVRVPENHALTAEFRGVFPAQVSWKSGDWAITVGGEEEVTVIGWNGTAASLSVPAQLNGLNVKNIGARAFEGSGHLQYIVIPEGVVSIGGSALKDTGLIAAALPSTLKTVGDNAFENAPLTSLRITGNLAENEALTGEMISGFVFPAALETIGASAFRNTSLQEISFPDSLISIGAHGFDGTGISQVTMPSSAVALGTQAFGSMTAVTNDAQTCEWIYTIDGDEITIIGWNGTAVDLVVPEDINALHVTGFGSRVFMGKTFLVSAVLPDDTDTMGTELFRNCTALETADLGDKSKTLPSQIFYSCRKLTGVVLPAALKTIGSYAFGLNSALTEVAVPEGVTGLGTGAFYGCANMTAASLPRSLEQVGDRAFSSCSSLVSVTLYDAVTTLGESVFSGCSALTDVTIGSGLITIQGTTFRGLPSLKNVTVNGTSTYIEDRAFENCTALQNVKLHTAYVGYSAFLGCSGLKYFSMDGGSLGDSAFSGCSLLETVYLGTGVNSIPSYCFQYLTKLRQVTVKGTLSEIPYSAFQGCGSLTDLTLSGSITYISSYAFAGCTSLARMSLPDNLQTIGSCAFSGCASLTTLRLPSGMTSIDNQAFYGCNGLQEIKFGGSVASIGQEAFRGCTGLKTISIPSGVQSIDESAFADCGALVSATLPDSVTYVGKYAFPATTRVYCDPASAAAFSISQNGGSFVSDENDMFGIRLLIDNGLSLGLSVEQIWTDETAMIIPEYIGGEMVTGIGSSAMASCPSVTQVTLPASVQEIPAALCKGNTSLVKVVIPEGVTAIGAEAFADCTHLTDVNIPETVAAIGERAFDGCELLREVELSAHIQEIGENAFSVTKVYAPLGSDTAKMLSRNGGGFVCREYPLLRLTYLFVGGEPTSLQVVGADENAVKLVVPADVTSIAAHAFENMSALYEVDLSESGVTEIGEYAFAGTGLKAMTLPDAVEVIPQYAFYNTLSMTSFTPGSGVTEIGEYAFAGSALQSVTFGDGLKKVGSYAFESCAGLMKCALPDSVTEMGSCTFQNAANLAGFDVPAGVTVIGDYTFQNCSGLAAVDLPEGLTEIRGYAFYNSGLASVTVPSTVQSIGYDAFEDCSSLAKVSMSGSMKSIGRGAFRNCMNLTTVIMPDALETMEPYAFYYDRKLSDITLPAGLNTVPSYAFNNCSGLTHVQVGDGTAQIESCAFQSCASLKSVELPTSLRQIDSYAFYSCGLTELTIPEGVTTIRESAFQDNNALEILRLPDTVVSLGNRAFYSCDKLREIRFSQGLVSLPESAFGYCGEALTTLTLPSGLRAVGAYTFSQDYRLTAVMIPESVTSIDDTAFQYIEPSQLTVYCWHDTEADTYAQNHGYNIVYLDGEGRLVGVTIEAVDPSRVLQLAPGETLEDIDTLFQVLPKNLPISEPISCSTGDETAATVENGVLTANAVGETVLRAAFENNPDIYAEIPVFIREHVTSYDLPEEIWILRDEDRTLVPENIVGAPDGYTWTVDRAIGEIVEGNILRATAFGSGVVTCTSWDGLQKSVTVHVYEDPTEVSLLDAPAGLEIGDTAILTSRVKAGCVFEDELARHFLTFSSSDESIAVVDQEGQVTAKGYGTAVISAVTEKGVTGTADIYVSPPITSFALEGRILAPVGATVELAATEIEPANANINAFTWTVEPAGLVEYNNGRVTVLTDQECEVRITATPWKGAEAKTTELTIYRPDVESVTIQPVNQWNWVESYSTIQLTALVQATNSTLTNQLVTWSVNGGDVSIDQNGMLHTYYSGSVTVTATADNGISGSLYLQVVPPTTDFVMPERITVQTGETVHVWPKSTVIDGYVYSSGDTWRQNYAMSVGTDSLAGVDGMYLTGKKPGRTELTVNSWNGVTRTCEVLVYDPIRTIEVSRIESKNGKYSASNPKTDLYCQMNYRAHSTAVSDRTYTDDLVTWSSSDPTVVRVDNAVTGEFRTLNYGTATLTATAANGTTGSIELNVRKEVRTFTMPEAVEACVLNDAELSVASITDEDAYDGFVWHVYPETLGTIEGRVLHVLSDVPATGRLTATSWDGYYTKDTALNIVRKPVTKVVLDEYGSGEAGVGGTYQMTAHVTAGAEYINEFITWSSSDESIATVNEKGLVSMLASGEVVITAASAEDPDINSSVTLTGVQGVDSFRVTPEEVTIYADETAELKISDILPENAVVRDFVWTANPEGIVTVENGIVTPVTKESAEGTITVSSWNGTKAEIPLKVIRPEIQSVTLDVPEILYMNNPVQLKAKVTLKDGTEFENRFIRWESGNEMIVTVDDKGMATGICTGDTAVYAYDAFDGTMLAMVNVKVEIRLESFDIYMLSAWGGYYLSQSDRTVTFYAANMMPSNAQADMTWTVTPERDDVVVTENTSYGCGIDVTYNGEEETELTVTAVDIHGATQSITVQAWYELSEFRADTDAEGMPAAVVLVPGDTAQTPVFGYDNNWNRLDGTLLNVTYTSGDEKIAAVDEKGLITAVGKGSTTVTATHKRSNWTDQIPVRVATKVESFDLPSRMTLAIGTEQELTVLNMKPAEAEVGDLLWTVEPANIAEIKDGKIRALVNTDATGTLTASSVNGVTHTCDLTVYSPWVSKVEFDTTGYRKVRENGRDMYLIPYEGYDQPVQLTACAWVDEKQYTNQLLTFSAYTDSGHNNTMESYGWGRINSDTGVIYPYNCHSFYIVATAASGENDEIYVRFVPQFDSFRVTDTLLVDLENNYNAYIDVKDYVYQEGMNMGNPNHNSWYLLYEEDDTGKFSVSEYGEVYINWDDERGSYCTGVGHVKISSINGLEQTTTVIAYRKSDIGGVSIVDAPKYARIYDTVPLTAVLTLFGEQVSGGEINSSLVTWSSSDESVAAVNSSGQVRLKDYGRVTITAVTENGHTASVEMNVVEEPLNFTLPETVTVRYGESVTLAPATVEPEDALMDIRWNVEPAELVKIEGNVLTAVVNESGTATLTAVNWDGSVRTAQLIIRPDKYSYPAFTLPAALTEIGEEAFAGFAAKRVVIPMGCVSVGSRAFADSDSLLVVEIPSSVTEIAADAFAGCDDEMIILGDADSYAQAWAEENGFTFEAY